MNDVNIADRAAGRPAGRGRIWPTVWPWLFWALWGAWLAVSDLRNDDVQPAVLVLFVGAAVLGAARPRTWWAWSVGLALWIVGESLVARVTGIPPSTPANPGVLLALIPALLGGVAGAALRRGAQSGRRSPA